MNVKIFILGRPGSGKSTAAHSINNYFHQRAYNAKHINDYDILKKMAEKDIEGKKFRRTPNNGFDATDLKVLDIALKEVKSQACKLSSAHVLTIEFARNDYDQALHIFGSTFVKNAYFLFLHADIETCLQRVHDRVKTSNTLDDHPSFSEHIFRHYYSDDNVNYMEQRLQANFGITKRIKIVDNRGTLQDFLKEIDEFAIDIYKTEMALLQKKLEPVVVRVPS